MSGSRSGPRACMVCSIIQTHLDFLQKGCPNCESILGFADNKDNVEECTSPVFEGSIAISDPTKSWVARWQRLDNYVPGVYAVKVVGNLPDDILQALSDNGVKYIPRDGSGADDEATAVE